MDGPFLTATLLVLGGMCCMYGVGLLVKDNSLIDIAYGPAFILAGWGAWLTVVPPPLHFRPLLLLVLLTLWGLRLGLHIALRHRGRGEDFRYRSFREQWGRTLIWRSFLQIYLLQGMVVVVIATPVLLTISNPGTAFAWTDGLGLALFAIGFGFEAVGDWQLTRFKADPANRGRIIQHGLWRYTRHPNYFGEAVLWWGIFLIGLGAPAGWYGLISPLTICFLLLKVSGIPMLEAKYSGNPEFAAYKARTNAFFPWLPRPEHPNKPTNHTYGGLMEHGSAVKGQQIAVIGAGVAGIVAAHRLQKNYRVTLFEQAERLGGHTHTVVIADGPDAGTPVDTGFIVFNEATYPMFIAFLDELGVASRETEMSFGLYCRQTGLIYAGNTFNGLFAQRANLLRPQFYRFLLEIGRFCRQAGVDLAHEDDLGTLEDYVHRHRFMPFMVDNYLKPMAAAIWSTPAGQVAAFPARSFLRFFSNHGLLSLHNRPRWRTVCGGSHRYVKAFADRFTGAIRLNSTIERVRRTEEGVLLEFADQHQERFDRLVIATHADQALRLLADPTAEEARLLGAWQYEANTTVLHTDLSVLPPLSRAWACWNFRREAGPEQGVYVTYSMNILQGLTTRNHYLVTLNRPEGYDPRQVVATMVYHHPTYTTGSMATQPGLPSLNGVRQTWFCGSYFGWGFHEDAVRSSHQAVAHLEATR